eukprot:1598623-Ditylum_brightwellii.AAC.1
MRKVGGSLKVSYKGILFQKQRKVGKATICLKAAGGSRASNLGKLDAFIGKKLVPTPVIECSSKTNKAELHSKASNLYRQW